MTPTTITEGHIARLKAAEDIEAAVYRAALGWAPAGQSAADARARLTVAERGVGGATATFRAALAEVSKRDRQTGDELHRLGVDGLTREAVGKDGGKLVNDAVEAATAVRKARAAMQEAQAATATATATSASAWRDVLLGYDALRQGVSADLAVAVARVLAGDDGAPGAVVPNATAGDVAERCKARLQELGA